jgi:hypothetical protein
VLAAAVLAAAAVVAAAVVAAGAAVLVLSPQAANKNVVINIVTNAKTARGLNFMNLSLYIYK